MCAKKLTEVFDVHFLQKFQDAFSDATGMASICTDLEGPITNPSNFTEFCDVLTRGTDTGYRRCVECDIRGGSEAEKTGRPAVYYCHAGLMDFGAPIIVDGEQVGSILGGQVLPQPPDEEKFRAIAREIGVDEEQYIKALRKVKIVPEKQIRQAANLLYICMSEISKMQTQYSRLEHSHDNIQTHVDYIDDMIRTFAGAVNDLSQDQKTLVSRLSSLKMILDNINKIVSAVSRIAQNSKLLSFNASVEAARSGREGQGFGVIAREMRNLADETTNTLNQIVEYTDAVLEAADQVMQISDTSAMALEEQLNHLESVFPRLQDIVKEVSSLNLSK